jgi:hypothetical protein
MPARALTAPLCPRCGRPNECAVSASGSFDVDCWCRTVSFAQGLPGTVASDPAATACLCRRCAAGLGDDGDAGLAEPPAGRPGRPA